MASRLKNISGFLSSNKLINLKQLFEVHLVHKLNILFNKIFIK